MNHNAQRRQSPPAVVWLFLGVLLAAMAIVAGMAGLAWQRTEQVAALRADLQALQAERQATEVELAALQDQAATLEDRLTTLEANDPARQLAALQAAVESAGDPQALDDLRATLAQIQARVDGFQTTLDALGSRLGALETAGQPASAGDLPAEVRLTVARQRQSHNLSCESSAASMVAQYHGLPLTEAGALNALPLNDNPHLGFRGNVDGPTGGIQDYGVYAGPILDLLNAQGLQATRVEGGLDGIRAALGRGNPVIAWVTYNCLPSTPTTATVGGQDVTLVPNQHVVVVTGYNTGGVWANDPWDGLEDFYSYADFQRALSYFSGAGSSPVMAIEVATP